MLTYKELTKRLEKQIIAITYTNGIIEWELAGAVRRCTFL